MIFIYLIMNRIYATVPKRYILPEVTIHIKEFNFLGLV